MVLLIEQWNPDFFSLQDSGYIVKIVKKNHWIELFKKNKFHGRKII